MTELTAADDLARAEKRAGVVVRSLTDLSDLDVARGIFDAVWPAADGSSQVPGNLLRALVHAGGYAAAAYRQGVPIGAAMGFVGRHRTSHGWHTHIHSHMAAVLPEHRDQHVGSALKLHQRAWALENGIDTVVWTFDPLVRRNARVNLLKLGADVDGFEVDFYGSMDDGINSGDPTDRLFAWWRLDSQRVVDAMAGRIAPLDPDERRASGSQVVQIALPEDIVRLRTLDSTSAADWRVRVRRQLLEALGAGYRITGLSITDDYILERPA